MHRRAVPENLLFTLTALLLADELDQREREVAQLQQRRGGVAPVYLIDQTSGALTLKSESAFLGRTGVGFYPPGAIIEQSH